jgi:hypothetical protein
VLPELTADDLRDLGVSLVGSARDHCRVSPRRRGDYRGRRRLYLKVHGRRGTRLFRLPASA